jgi:hypothetical protein
MNWREADSLFFVFKALLKLPFKQAALIAHG